MKKSVTRVKRFTETLEPKEDLYIAEDGSVFGTGDVMEQSRIQKLRQIEKGIKRDEHTSDLFLSIRWCQSLVYMSSEQGRCEAVSFFGSRYGFSCDGN